jgi:hypothetical protein
LTGEALFLFEGTALRGIRIRGSIAKTANDFEDVLFEDWVTSGTARFAASAVAK